jgi:LysM repeat protein
MKKETQQLERRGLPGGPNEMFTYTTGMFSTEGFRMDSPDVNNYQNIIPSGSITMKERDGSPLRKGPIHGVDNLGYEQVMYPGFDYEFPGTEVTETLMAKMGGALLDKTIKCGNCGWEWKAADGGSDLYNCHKCKGGKGLVKAQEGLEYFNNVKDWYNNYTKSPGYLENLKKSGYENPQAIIDERLANINATKFKNNENRLGSYYRNKKINYSPIKDQENFPGSEPDSSLAHEFGHSSIDTGKGIFDGFKAGYNKYDFEQLKNRNKNPKISRGEHENYADLKAIQYEAEKQGLYKAGYGEFTEEIFNKLKNSGHKERLLDNFSKEDIIWFENNLAQNNNQPQMPVAQVGVETTTPDKFAMIKQIIQNENKGKSPFDIKNHPQYGKDLKNTKANAIAKKQTINYAKKLNAEAEQKRIADERAIIADREARMADAMKAQDEDVIGNPNWREVLARETQSTGDKFRLFPNDPDSFVDDWLNPGVMIGDMVSSLGSAPLRARDEDSYMPYVTSIGTPLALGALGGLGTSNTRQFVNNLVNPLAGTGDLAKAVYNKGVTSLGNLGIRTSVAPELREGLQTAGPSFGSTVDNVTPTFKSEIDWGNWNKEIPENTQLMDEYNAIEQQAKADGTWMKYEKKVLDEEKTLNNKRLFDEQEKQFNLKNVQEEEVRKSLYEADKAKIELEETNKLLDSKFQDYFDNASAQWKRNFESNPESKLEFLDIKGVNSKEIDGALESLSSNIKNREADLLAKYESAPINKFDRPNESVYTTSIEDFPGTPEQFIQSNSENFKKAYPEGWGTVWRGGDIKPELNSKFTKDSDVIFTSKDEYGANVYNRSEDPYVKLKNGEIPEQGLTKLYAPKTENKIVIDGQDSFIHNGKIIKEGRRGYSNLDAIDQTPITSVQEKNLNSFKNWMRKENPKVDLNDETTTDLFAQFLNSPEGKDIDRVEFKKIFDSTNDPIDVEVHNLHNRKQLKSMFGNNGMFDMTNPNIYKTVVPGAIGLGTLGLMQEKEGGELTEYQKKGEVKIDLKHSQDIYDQIRPSEYTSLSNYGRYLFGITRDEDEYDDVRSEEAFKQYLGLNTKPQYLSKSKYAPSIKGEGKKGSYYKVDPELERDIFYSYKDKLKLNQVLPTSENDVESDFPEGTPMTSDGYVKLDPYDDNLLVGRPMVSRARMLGNFNVSRGKDEKGEYISYSDQYDFPGIMQSRMKGKPYKIYNRIYYNDMKEEGGETITPADTTAPSPLVEYVVKKGDTLSKIAAANNTSVRSIMQNNESISDPNVISINQKINLVNKSVDTPKEEVYKDWNTIRDKKDKINKLSDEQKIVSFYNDKPEDTYLIVDKKNAVMKLYTGGNLTKSFEVGVGQTPGDAQTVTKVKDGKTDWSAGNKSTGAGIYTISNINPASTEYYNEPAFNLKNENGIEVATTIHGTPKSRRIKFNNGTVIDNRMSNGCINGKCEDLKELYGQLDLNTKVYILPEDKGNNFQIIDGKPALRVSAQNRQKYNTYVDQTGATQKGQGSNQTTNTLVYKPITATLDEAKFKDDVFQWNDFNDEKEYANTTKPFVAALTTNKKQVMKAAKISSDVYNELAKMSFGIYGTESNFGDTHSAVGNLARATNKFLDPKSSSSPDYKSKAGTYGADEETRSVGLTQLRWNYLNKDEKAALKEVGITSNKDFLDPKKAAIGTVTVLGVRYNQQLNDKQKQDVWKYLPTKWNNRANYSDRVKSNSSYLSFKQLDKKQDGGENMYTVTGDQPIIIPSQGSYPTSYQYLPDNMQPTTVPRKDVNGIAIPTNILRENQREYNRQRLVQPEYEYLNRMFDWMERNNATEEDWVKKLKKDEKENSKYHQQEGTESINKNSKSSAVSGSGILNKLNPFGPGCIYTTEDKSGQKKRAGGESKPGSLMQAYNRLPTQKKMGGVIANKKQFGGQLNSGNITMYRDYIKGTIGNEIEAVKNYDKLNRIYYNKAKDSGMTVANYIMTYIANNS